MIAGNIRIELVQVTPAVARRLLGQNAENQRRLRNSKVAQYARDMAVGHWPITGDTVKVTPDGQLIDGQHRMAAVIEADCAVPMLIAYDVDASVMPVLDTGAARNFGDVLRITGTPNRMVTGAVVRRILQWERGNYIARAAAAAGADTTDPTHIEMLERYEKDAEAFDTAAARGEDIRRARVGSSTAAGTAFFLFADIDHEKAHAFFDSYVSGAALPPGHPILALRNRMTRISRDERLTTTEQLALIVRAWNAYRADRPLERVLISRKTLNNRTFPMPK